MPARSPIPLPPRYRDARPLARGGMGEILLARDEELDRPVVIKVLSEQYAEDESRRRRFEREALAAARLSSNPNTVTIFDVAEHEGRPLIVMEYMPGGSLEERTAGSGPCDRTEAIGWLADAANALDAAHAAGVVHRDVKPGNLLLDDRDHVHVADFGIASAVGLDSFTQVGTVLGTAGYLSPEQARGERATAASDHYALAIVAWELLVGRRPFESTSPTAEASAHVNAPVPSISAANPRLPRWYDDVFEQALAKDPDARFPSSAAFVEALHDAVSPHPPASAPRRQRVKRGVPGPALIVLLAVLVVAGGAAAVLASRHDASPPAPTTVERTVTTRGTTVATTATTAPASTTAPPPSSSSGVTLNNETYQRMLAHDYQGALPLLEEAVPKLQGTGSLSEAYADYNLAFKRLALGQCTDVVSLLDASQRIQGGRKEIDGLRKQAEKRC